MPLKTCVSEGKYEAPPIASVPPESLISPHGSMYTIEMCESALPAPKHRDVLPPATKRSPVWFAHTACALTSSAPPPPASPGWPDDMTSTTIAALVSICLQRHGGLNSVNGAPEVAEARMTARDSSAGGTTTKPRSPLFRSSSPIARSRVTKDARLRRSESPLSTPRRSLPEFRRVAIASPVEGSRSIVHLPCQSADV